MNISLIGQFRLQGLQMEIKVIYFPFLFYSTDFNTVCNGIQQALIQAIIHSHNITFLPLFIKSLLGWMLKSWWYDLLLLKLMCFNKYAWDCLDELSQNNKDGLLESSSSTQLSPYSQGRVMCTSVIPDKYLCKHCITSSNFGSSLCILLSMESR